MIFINIMGKILLKLVSSDSGISSKRVITLVSCLVLFVSLFLNQVLKMNVDLRFIEALEWIIMAGLTTTVAERFSKSKQINTDTNKLKNDEIQQ